MLKQSATNDNFKSVPSGDIEVFSFYNFSSLDDPYNEIFQGKREFVRELSWNCHGTVRELSGKSNFQIWHTPCFS